MFVYILIWAFVGFYLWLKSCYTFWEKRNVPHPPVNLIFGNIFEAFILKKSLGQIYEDVYNKYPNLAYVGFYRARTQGVILRDPELIKDVLVKEFQSFHDNNFDIDMNYDPMFGRNPFTLKGDAWKISRNQMTSGFTTTKIKALFPVMEETSKKFVDFLQSEEKAVNNGGGIDAKEACSKFTTENVISCAFGIEANCFKDDKAEFREIGRKTMNEDILNAIKFFIFFALPSASKFFSIKVISDEAAQFFRNVVKNVVKYRQENNVKRNDYLNSLLEIKAKNPGSFDDEDLTAHIVGLFIDGFITSSIALSFALYGIAANPNVQEKLRQEIDEISKSEKELTYENLLNMTYLDAVMMETLRLWNPVPFMVRLSTKPYKLPTPDGREKNAVDIPINTNMIISSRGLHLDPKYFPDPMAFKPERFLEEGFKESYPKYAFLPFGEGPRICLGMRFAICQVKLCLYHVVKNFELKVNKKTIEPLEIDPNSFLLAAKGGIWLNFLKRN